MKMGYFFLGLLLCVSGDVVCMKRSAISSNSEEQDDAKRQRRMLEADFLCEDEDEKESDSDSKESSDSSIAAAIEVRSEIENESFFGDSLLEFGDFLSENSDSGAAAIAVRSDDSDSKESSESEAAAAMEIDSEGEDESLFDEASFDISEVELHVAIQANNDAGVRELLEKGSNVLARDVYNDGDTALHCAMRARTNDTITQQLLDAMADVEARNDDSLTPLLAAAEMLNFDGIRFLIDAKADSRAVVTDTGETVLHRLVQRPCGVECLREMVCRYGIDMRARDLTGNTAAFAAVNLSHHTEGFYLARMKYIMERIYNRLYVAYNRNKVMSHVDFGLVTSSSSPFARDLSRLVVDYLFFVKDKKGTEATAAE